MALSFSTTAAQKFKKVGNPLLLSPHFKPIAYHDAKVYAANTNNDTIDVIDAVTGKVNKRINVGVDPVCVVVRPDGKEIWVSNHISDSVSVIDNDPKSKTYHTVIATIQELDLERSTTAFDEPVGIAFADNKKAYVALSSHNRIAVVDVASRKVTKQLVFTAQEPRALIVKNDKLYVIPFESNNRTQLSAGKGPVDNKLVTVTLKDLAPVFETSGIVIDIIKHPKMPDKDLFIFDTKTDKQIKVVSGLGTLQYGLAVDNKGNAFIAQTDARNHINGRSGTKKHALKQLENRPWLNQITKVDTNGKSSFLNFEPLPPKEIKPGNAFATPFGIELSNDDKTIFMTAAGSHKLAAMTTSGKVLSQVTVGAVPRGIALQNDAAGKPKFAWVLNAASNSVTKVDVSNTARLETLKEIALKDLIPEIRKKGRIAFNTAKASSNGTFACASCHPDGHTDQLLWVLDTPYIRNAKQVEPRLAQQLRGLRGTAPYHWDGIPGDPYGGPNATTYDFLKPNSDIKKPETATRHLIDGGLGSTMLKPGSMVKNDEGKKGLLTKVERDAMALFILDIPYMPPKGRSFKNELSKQATLGIERFHVTGSNDSKHVNVNVCGMCHTLPYLQTSSGGMDVPSFIGALDRTVAQAQGRQHLVDTKKYLMEKGMPEEELWKTLIAGGEYGRLFSVIDMFREASTVFSGAFGRQFTLDAKTLNQTETKFIWDALEKDAKQGGVVLTVDGYLKSTGKKVSMQYSAGSYIHKSGSVSRKKLQEMAAKGDFIGTFTGRHGSDAFSPPPALWPKGKAHVQRGIQLFPRVNKSRMSMVLCGQGIKDGAHILVNGKKVKASIKSIKDKKLENVIEIRLAKLPRKGINFLQVQNPGSFFSNEFIFFNETKSEAIARYKIEKDYLLTSAFNSAIIMGSLEDAEILLEAGAKTTLPNDTLGNLLTSPIILAAAYGRKDIIKLLLSKGADVNKQDGRGDTALHMASKTCRPDIIKQLLKAGANPKLLNKHNQTPAMLAGGIIYLAESQEFRTDIRWPLMDLDFDFIAKNRDMVRKML